MQKIIVMIVILSSLVEEVGAVRKKVLLSGTPKKF